MPYVIPLGSSPLARGLLRSHSNFFGTRWIIPARAGFTKQVGVHLPNIGDHPRSRGVYVNAFGTADAIAGSSPLARGLRNTRPGKRKCSWIIPARAGFTRAGPASAGSPRDHPRSRGVYLRRELLDVLVEGSSPLARGLPKADTIVKDGAGIIPARAGFTCRPRYSGRGTGDHPRSRGVYPH